MKIIVLYIFSFFVVTHIVAQKNIKTNWQAQWIGEDSPSIPNTFFKYRYSFTQNEIPTKAMASIATDSKYWLYINEKLVVFEGQLKRGLTPDDTYYDEVNIQPFLQKGNNTIAILVWYWGKEGFCHKSSGKAGLLFEAAIDNKIITSNAEWKTAQHLSYQNTV